jgi:hypothetical protein
MARVHRAALRRPRPARPARARERVGLRFGYPFSPALRDSLSGRGRTACEFFAFGTAHSTAKGNVLRFSLCRRRPMSLGLINAARSLEVFRSGPPRDR